MVARGISRALVVVVAAACSDAAAVPPYGEVLIVVDTDLPTPRIVDHLRIDVYSADGASWLASRDVLRASWPTSFALYTTDPARGRDALVRLRAYGGAYVADYRGERFAEKPTPVQGMARFDPAPPPTAPFATTDCPDCPLLYDATGANVTPPSTPLAALAVDRLVLVHVQPGAVQAAQITLLGACLGAGADLAGLRTCVDTEATLVPVTQEPLVADVSLPATSKQGTFEAPYAAACAGQPRAESGVHDEDVCAQGGLFVLGARNLITGTAIDAYPERMAAISSFYVDRYEFSVGRYRDVIKRGYTGPTDVVFNNGPANDPNITAFPARCTMSNAPMGREDAPLNCVTPATARALCQYGGGDLPTEPQWEYAATALGRPAKALTPPLAPTGLPDCAGVAVARNSTVDPEGSACTKFGYGTAPVTFGEAVPDGDVTSGIVGLSANVSEMTSDAFASFGSVCWASATLGSPTCPPESAVESVSLRGANWNEFISVSTYMIRAAIPTGNIGTTQGFRCVRSAN